MPSARSQSWRTLGGASLSWTPGGFQGLDVGQICGNVDEAISLLPGVDSRMSPMGFAGFIRGFGGSPFQEGIQFQLDGLLYNSPDKGGSAAIPG